MNECIFCGEECDSGKVGEHPCHLECYEACNGKILNNIIRWKDDATYWKQKYQDLDSQS